MKIFIFSKNFGARAEISARFLAISKSHFFGKCANWNHDFASAMCARAKIFEKWRFYTQNISNFNFWKFWRARAKNMSIWKLKIWSFFGRGVPAFKILLRRAYWCARAKIFRGGILIMLALAHKILGCAAARRAPGWQLYFFSILKKCHFWGYVLDLWVPRAPLSARAPKIFMKIIFVTRALRAYQVSPSSSKKWKS